MSQTYLQSTFAVAPTDTSRMPFNNHGRTLRLVMRPNQDAFAVSVRFGHYYAAGGLTVGAVTLARCDEHGVLLPETLVPLTVGGVLSFVLEPGRPLLSDTATFAVQAGRPFALSIYYPGDERVTSGNWSAGYARRSRPGNFSASVEMPGPGLVNRFARTVVSTDMTVLTTSVCEVILHCRHPGRVIGCFGDSITQQNNWTGPLYKLLGHRYPGEVSLCNLGISGNRLLGDSPPAHGGLYGEAGIRRFERDLLFLHGLTHAVLAIGSNDLGHPGSLGVPESELITPEEYAAAMEGLAGRLHERGVKVYAATILPRAIDPPYTEVRDAIRRRCNEWIRTAGCFDAVLDFDAVLRREDGGFGIQEGCVLPDGLHPSPYGGLLLAKSIDLALFGGDADAC